MFTIPFPLELEKEPSDQDTLLSLEPAFFGDLKRIEEVGSYQDWETRKNEK